MGSSAFRIWFTLLVNGSVLPEDRTHALPPGPRSGSSVLWPRICSYDYSLAFPSVEILLNLLERSSGHRNATGNLQGLDLPAKVLKDL